MNVFKKIAGLAASELLGRSADNPASVDDLADKMESIALDDPELAEHYKRLEESGPVMETVRLEEEAR